jgi:ATP-dependent exoDNAse (exonuclease V) alpha subunit
MTINKSQGQTLNQVGIYLSQPVFSHGQLYTALSRATSHQNVRVLIGNGETCQTRNIVYNEVLNPI